MPDLLTPLQLGPKQIDQAFPIVQSLMPGLSVEDWRYFAARITEYRDDLAGIMTVQSQGYIHGLFSYKAEPHLAHGRVLMVDNFIVLDLFNPAAVAEALLRAMDELALRLDCKATHTMLPDGPHAMADYRHWLLGRFRTQGHQMESVALCKRLGQEAAAPPRAANGNGRSGVKDWVGGAE